MSPFLAVNERSTISKSPSNIPTPCIDSPLALPIKVALGCFIRSWSNDKPSSLYSAAGDSKPVIPASANIGITFIFKGT